MPARLPVPDVVIGGAPRSGTTFLATVLDKHPGVFLAKPLVPEPKVCLREHPEGNSGYLADYAKIFAGAPENAVRIEKTTNYFENEAARLRLSNVLPETRFLFILREPVERAYSNWKWSRLNGLEKLPFAEAVRMEGERPNPFGKEREAARPFDYLSRGHYGSLAEEWYRLFGRDRIRFLLFEHVVESPQPVFAALQDWLGVQVMPWEELHTGKINPTPEEPADIDPYLRSQLRSQIYPEVEKFQRISGLDISRWGYSKSEDGKWS